MLLKKIVLKAAAALLFMVTGALQAAEQPEQALPSREQAVPDSGQAAPASGQTAPPEFQSGIACAGVPSSPDVDALQQRLWKHKNHQADFVQEKMLKNLQQTLRSRGRVVISASCGIYWKQTAPFEMEMQVTRNFISQQLPGKKKLILDERSSPRFFEFASLLAAITTADQEELEKNFSLTFRPAGGGEWLLDLVPRDGVAAEVFSSVEIRGGDFLSGIVLYDTLGDVTTIEFSGQTEVVPDEKLWSYFEP